MEENLWKTLGIIFETPVDNVANHGVQQWGVIHMG